jgi:hypothetical protein
LTGTFGQLRNGALHVRKGKVRFQIAASATDEQLKALASGVVAQL